MNQFIEPNAKEGMVVVKVNPEVYPIDLVYEAAYSVMDRAYIILDGSPSETIYAILRPRTFKGELMELGQIFYDELVSAAYYAVQIVRNKEVRDALISSLTPQDVPVPAVKETQEVAIPEDEDFTQEEKEIATLWEDKYGKRDDSEGCEEEGK